MRINFSGTTNKDYLMVNTLKIKLKSGSIITLDRRETGYTISEPENGIRLLEMEWFGCYLWELDGETLFTRECVIDEDVGGLFTGANFVELELEDDADEDYSVDIRQISINGTPIVV